MIDIKNKVNCTSCSACYNICPKNAISMKEDKEGFKYPKIDKEKCVGCNLCSTVCPMLNQYINNGEYFREPEIMAAWSRNENIRLDSTSGGIFSELAIKTINEGGYICGAVYNKDWTVKHILTNNIEDLKSIRSSKYLQSNINLLYREIEDKLKEGKKVLMCGSPCQIQGIHRYLRKDYENLILCDFICRGMNSPKIFVKYIRDLERKYKSKIVNVKFKNKTYGWHNFSTKIDFENGKSYIKSRYIDSYMIGYLQYNAFMRPSCYECKFKSLPRSADITLADFWGIENIDKSLDNNKGTSLVLLNTKKGQELFKSLKNEISYKQIKSDKVFSENICMTKSPIITKQREEVFKEIDDLDYSELCKKYFPIPKIHRRIKIYFREKIKDKKRNK